MKRSSTKEKVNQYKLLHKLYSTDPDSRHNILHFIGDKGLHCIGEYVHNCLLHCGNLTPMKKKQIGKKLKPQKNAFKKIANKNTNNETRRRLLQEQSGSGLLTTLLGVGLPLLTSFLFPSKK